MKISREEVLRVARLARLELSEDKVELFAGQVGDILDYIDQLNRLDTEGVEPMYGPGSKTTLLRPDAVRRECGREQVLANAPETDGAFFIVPRIVSAGH
ncbi:Asp-tRNA(Asn)/Glu-tRNA(Gln) amidotransferase subunit GatC [Desulfovibrio aminophilus]|uniref:Asp-tRNA(Asn)/Glu-tRNA(Gln) amidotransferase subunit GatC n=1 Tax=Desulfovibrio aminophilus TaxID=81425 RepID=UPI003391B44C